MFKIFSLRKSSVAVLFSVATLLATSTVASASPQPKIAVNPTAGLHNGQIVKVHGSGFTPGDSVYIVECLFKAQGQSDCAIVTATPAKISAKGTLPMTKFKVVTGKVGGATCGTTAKNARACDISVGNVTGTDSTSHRIAFKVGHTKKSAQRTRVSKKKTSTRSKS